MRNEIELYIEKEAEKIRKEIENSDVKNISMTPEQSERVWKSICDTLRRVYGDDFPY